MRNIKVTVVQGIFKMFTEYEGKIEVGSPLYICDDGTVTPIENGNEIIGKYDVSNQDRISNMGYHIKTRLRNECIVSFEFSQDRDACFELLDNQMYVVGIDKEDTIIKIKLKAEQPPAGEFTKEMRLTYELRPKIIEGKIAAKHIFDLCDRLDCSEASRKKLLEALERYGDHEPGCIKGDACICGFEAALAAEKEGKE